MTSFDVLRVLAEDGGYLSARQIAAKHYGISERDAVWTGRGIQVARIIAGELTLTKGPYYVARDYGDSSVQGRCLYKITDTGRALLYQHDTVAQERAAA